MRLPILIVALLALISPLSSVRAQADETMPPLEARTYMPLLRIAGSPLSPQYDTVPVLGPPVDRAPAINADLNLVLRWYRDIDAQLDLVDIGGPSDSDPPQLAGIFAPSRLPRFAGAYQVHDWNWDCGEHGCRGDPILAPPVTLIALETRPGEALSIPSRGAEIYRGGYRALVLYATPERLTVVYTRQDTPAFGYVVHLEDLVVEPALVALYQEMDDAGRSRLPALRNGERLGTAAGETVKLAVRDAGSFMDPRSRKDWWKGY